MRLASESRFHGKPMPNADTPHVPQRHSGKIHSFPALNAIALTGEARTCRPRLAGYFQNEGMGAMGLMYAGGQTFLEGVRPVGPPGAADLYLR